MATKKFPHGKPFIYNGKNLMDNEVRAYGVKNKVAVRKILQLADKLSDYERAIIRSHL